MNIEILRRVINEYPIKRWLISYISDVKFAEYRDQRNYIRGRLIDIGCGTKPYKSFWSSNVTEHVGIDHADTLHDKSSIDIVASAYDIPEEDDSFDSAICNAVLEHLEEPLLAINECFRLLRPSGIAIYSVPFIWHLHEEPRDFYRFSKYGLVYLFEKAGFEIIEVTPLSGFWVTFGQLFVYYIYRFNRGIIRWSRLIVLIGLIIQICAYFLDRVDRTERWTWIYFVVAQKPAI